MAATEGAAAPASRPCASGAALSSVKRSAALRVKYATRDDTVHIPPDLVGMHPRNRHGVGLNGACCEDLLRSVFRCWSNEEANLGAVAIEEQPGRARFLEYNREKVLCDDRLAAVDREVMPYASLGSAHINQVLRNVLGSARAESCSGAVDASGCLQLALVSAADPAMARACRAGLRWEVLSYKLEVEEPDGVVCISAALNEAGTAHMLQHEMESVKQLALVCSTETCKASVVWTPSAAACCRGGLH